MAARRRSPAASLLAVEAGVAWLTLPRDRVDQSIAQALCASAEAIAFDDGARLDFSAETERRKEEKRMFVSYTYRQPFGTFSGSLAGGFELARGFGVMEHHDAHW